MGEWDRAVPGERTTVRRLEVFLAVTVIALPLLTGVIPAGGIDPLVDVGVVPVLSVPPLLGIVVLIGAVDDGISLGSVAVSLLALVTLVVAASSIAVLINPPTGGGVYGGHLFTFAAGLALAGGVLIRTGVAVAQSRV